MTCQTIDCRLTNMLLRSATWDTLLFTNNIIFFVNTLDAKDING
jgi:hypothetical protein